MRRPPQPSHRGDKSWRPLRAALVAALVGGALLVFAPGALASTVTYSGTTLTVTGDPATFNDWSFDDSAGGGTVDITFNQDPHSGALPSNCTVTVPGPPEVVECTGVDSIVTNSGDVGSNIDGSGLGSTPITENGGAGDDNLVGGDQADNIHGNAGDDSIAGGQGGDVLDGGDGNDSIYGLACCGSNPDGNDTITGGNGDDNLHGQVGNDTVDGGPGDDSLAGGPGDDVLTGDAGDDFVAGGPGQDTLNGGAGDDYLDEFVDTSPDTYIGGDGVDVAEYDVNGASTDLVTASIDGQANDGFHPGPSSLTPDDSHNNIGTDVEQIDVFSNQAPVQANGSASANVIHTFNNAPDTVDAGDGADQVFTEDGDDTINAVDGFPDYIDCGDGNDTANVDQFDTTVHCENVHVTNVPSKFQDAPPTVSWVAPPNHSTISGNKATTLRVNAADDHGVSKVVFSVGDRVLCTDTAAPYTCSYLPTGKDVGRDTLVAVATDTANQTATALDLVTVPRIAAKSLGSHTRPKKDTSSPFVFTTSGKLNLPANVAKADGCKGKVSVQYRAGKKTVSNRRTNLRKNCTYKSKVRFTIPSRLHPKTLQVLVRFLGNADVKPKKARSHKVTV